MLVILDLATVGVSFVAAWLWHLASRNRLRRIARDEALDARDINRIIVTLNRTQILSSRAAIATGCAASLAAARFAVDALLRG